ncbi:MAG: hypothetical protein HYS44_03210 [Candidatus Niyogibacteria bacterium]|nr:hypothetical protein [Candidatus Niyogibacteria bacterium]
MLNFEYPLGYVRSQLPDIVELEKGQDNLVSFRFPGDEGEGILPCFQIVFHLKFDTERYPDEDYVYDRWLRCLNHDRAIYIAHHMVGEEVYPGKFIDTVKNVFKTDPSMRFVERN